MGNVILEDGWKKALVSEFEKDYFKELNTFVKAEYASKTVFPHPKQILRAFDVCPFDKVKVVILGQDPYHGISQANGLSFAVNIGVTLPPSLKNIFSEIKNDIEIAPLQNGDLTRWAKQGVLLLNSVLTVQSAAPASHKNKGWEVFTSAAINALNYGHEHIVYMLWGKYAQDKGRIIDRSKNLVLISAHPSPYSVTNFYGNHHFSRCNEYLLQHGQTPINWE
jgi:uracil-DNA glycosylase